MSERLTLIDDRFAADLMVKELMSARKKFGPLNSQLEGWAILHEEMTELFDAIRSKDCTDSEIKEEAIQVGAMAIRFVVDCGLI